MNAFNIYARVYVHVNYSQIQKHGFTHGNISFIGVGGDWHNSLFHLALSNSAQHWLFAVLLPYASLR